MKYTDKYIGQQIKIVQKNKGVTQAELGSLINYSQTQVSKLEAGTRKVSATKLLLICDALGITLDELLHAEAM